MRMLVTVKGLKPSSRFTIYGGGAVAGVESTLTRANELGSDRADRTGVAKLDVKAGRVGPAGVVVVRGTGPDGRERRVTVVARSTDG
jgi:hypothetical protein